jgi:hypothetical protein
MPSTSFISRIWNLGAPSTNSADNSPRNGLRNSLDELVELRRILSDCITARNLSVAVMTGTFGIYLYYCIAFIKLGRCHEDCKTIPLEGKISIISSFGVCTLFGVARYFHKKIPPLHSEIEEKITTILESNNLRI